MELTTTAREIVRLTEPDIAALAERNGEPAWLRERRLRAWRAWERLPLPDPETQLEWRRTNPSALKLETLLTVDPEQASGTATLAPLAGDLAAVLRLVDGQPVAHTVCAEAAEQNVRVLPFAEALREMPDVLEAAFMTEAVRADESKFAALHGALTNGGAVVYVPRGVEVAKPIYISDELTEGGVAAFPHLLVVAEPMARVSVIFETYSEGTGHALVVPVVEVIARDGAVVTYVDLQRWGADIVALPQLRSVCHRDAKVTLATIALGSGVTKGRIGCELIEPGASGDLLGMLFPAESQHFEMDTLQRHVAPQTTSNLVFRTALEGKGVSISNGMVRIEREAQKSDAFQENRNLLLSDGARADPIPALEILANDVRCSHGTTVSPVDEEQTYYLQCRGLRRPEAERLLVHGFFQEVLDRIPGVVEPRVKDEIERKIHRLLEDAAA